MKIKLLVVIFGVISSAHSVEIPGIAKVDVEPEINPDKGTLDAEHNETILVAGINNGGWAGIKDGRIGANWYMLETDVAKVDVEPEINPAEGTVDVKHNEDLAVAGINNGGSAGIKDGKVDFTWTAGMI